MNLFDVKRSLASMQICVDTREQDTDNAKRRYSDFGCGYYRGKLEYGDYCFSFQYPDGKWLLSQDDDAQINPLVVIERKMNLDELCLCLGKERKRFEAEMERAKQHKAKIYLLVENATWENALNGKYRSKLNPKALVSSLLAWSIRYNMVPVFCKSETSGKMIYNILYRELKEYLENLEWSGEN
jgi:ERCC4-type nuclease